MEVVTISPLGFVNRRPQLSFPVLCCILSAMKQMMTIKLPPDEANLDEVRRRMNLGPEEIDNDFGVVSIDPKKNLYAVMVEEKASQKLSEQNPKGVKGPYSNPRIEPFGPPK